jgi:hypothetical protein
MHYIPDIQKFVIVFRGLYKLTSGRMVGCPSRNFVSLTATMTIHTVYMLGYGVLPHTPIH